MWGSIITLRILALAKYAKVFGQSSYFIALEKAM